MPTHSILKSPVFIACRHVTNSHFSYSSMLIIVPAFRCRVHSEYVNISSLSFSLSFPNFVSRVFQEKAVFETGNVHIKGTSRQYPSCIMLYKPLKNTEIIEVLLILS